MSWETVEGAVSGMQFFTALSHEVICLLTGIHRPALLREIADTDRGTDGHAAGGGPEPSGGQIEQSALTGAVAAYDADAVGALDVVSKVINDRFLPKGAADGDPAQ